MGMFPTETDQFVKQQDPFVKKLWNLTSGELLKRDDRFTKTSCQQEFISEDISDYLTGFDSLEVTVTSRLIRVQRKNSPWSETCVSGYKRILLFNKKKVYFSSNISLSSAECESFTHQNTEI